MKPNIRIFDIISALVVALPTVSCTLSDVQGNDTCSLTLELQPQQVKSNTEWISEEQQFKNVYFFIFDLETGYIEDIIGGPANSIYETSIRYGSKKIIALVNVHNKTLENLMHSSIKTIPDLENQWFFYPKGSEMECLPAYCSTLQTIDSSSQKIIIPVKNIMSRFMLMKVTNNLQGHLSGKTITLRNVFLSNLLGLCPIRNTYTEADMPDAMLWYHKAGRKYQATSADEIIAAASDGRAGTRAFQTLNVNIPPGSSYNCDALYGLYAFMNPYTTDTQGWTDSGHFTPRFTRMVVTAEIDGQTSYYPINLTNFKQGYSYDVSLTITQSGSDDPDTSVPDGNANSSIDINQWDLGDNYGEDL